MVQAAAKDHTLRQPCFCFPGNFIFTETEMFRRRTERREAMQEEDTVKSGLIHPGERLDDLQNGYWMIQNPKQFCYGIDAVLLAAYAKVRERECVLDFCTGSGIVPILLKAKTKGQHFTGLEIQHESADMARRSVEYNDLNGWITIVEGDVCRAGEYFPASSFDVVTCNPPYMTGNHGLTNANQAKTIARHEVLCCLEDIVRVAAQMLRTGGRFYLVHRPFRLAEIMTVLKQYHLEPKRMQLVYPFVDKEPNLVLLEAAKGGKPRITVEKPLIVYEKPGVYTEDIRRLYGDGR